MKAAVVHRFGQPPRFEPFPDPTPGADEVLVQVRAAGLHPVVDVVFLRARELLGTSSSLGGGDADER